MAQQDRRKTQVVAWCDVYSGLTKYIEHMGVYIPLCEVCCFVIGGHSLAWVSHIAKYNLYNADIIYELSSACLLWRHGLNTPSQTKLVNILRMEYIYGHTKVIQQKYICRSMNVHVIINQM